MKTACSLVQILRNTNPSLLDAAEDLFGPQEEFASSGKEAVMCVREVVFYPVCGHKENRNGIRYCYDYNSSLTIQPCPNELVEEHRSTKVFCYACYLARWDAIMDHSARREVALVQSAIKLNLESECINRIKEKQDEETNAALAQLDRSCLSCAAERNSVTN
ncbi:hypothetical protein N7G274_007665 [Stereocaulon virgatum]|uniref:Uncharacterized protein n=1 Tax=Stereocaulon virgatum TaxID=373712 RepID=A0ABR4A2X8_9LECA